MDNYKIPRHIGIIMDGNGRWAQKRGNSRSEGHEMGTRRVRTAISYCSEKGVEVLTLYAFSTENWKRPQAEVNTLMNLMVKYLKQETPEMKENNVVLHFIGDVSLLPARTREAMEYSKKETENNSGLTVNIAVNYGGHAEIVRAFKLLYSDITEGKLSPDEIDETAVEQRLYTAGQPDADLIIRTGAVKRLSNFMPWQSAYAEFYFTDVLWPDFDEACFDEAIDYFNGVSRRFGGL